MLTEGINSEEHRADKYFEQGASCRRSPCGLGADLDSPLESRRAADNHGRV